MTCVLCGTGSVRIRFIDVGFDPCDMLVRCDGCGSAGETAATRDRAWMNFHAMTAAVWQGRCAALVATILGVPPEGVIGESVVSDALDVLHDLAGLVQMARGVVPSGDESQEKSL